MVRGKGVVWRRVRVLPPGREAVAWMCWEWERGLARVKRVMAALRAVEAGVGGWGAMVIVGGGG